LTTVLPFLFLHQDRLDDVIRILVDDGSQLVAIQQVILFRAKMQRYFSATIGFLHHFDGELSAAVGFPADALIRAFTRASGHNSDLV